MNNDPYLADTFLVLCPLVHFPPEECHERPIYEIGEEVITDLLVRLVRP